MATDSFTTQTASPQPRHFWHRVLTYLGVAILSVALAWTASSALNRWAVTAAIARYQPQDGDVIFQSLPHGPVVWAIEGVTGSPYSHCGIVAKVDDQWIVYEAYRGVSATPLNTFLTRGRGGGFAVYRLRDECSEHIPSTLACCRLHLGKPYDIRYRLDDEKIYCSELIYKAYLDATHGQQLGDLVKFGDMNWQPYELLIRQIEGGEVPVDREMITPANLARAPQLEPVFSHNLKVEQPTTAR